MKAKKLNESFNLDSFLNRLQSSVDRFTIEHPFNDIDIKFTEQQASALTSKLNQWEKFASSETAPQQGDPNYEEKMKLRNDVESQIINMISEFSKQSAPKETEAPATEVPTVPFESKKFKNIKSFAELMAENSAANSPMAKFKSQAKSDIRNKINTLGTKSSAPREDKPEGVEIEKDITSLKSEIATKMRELDGMFKSNDKPVDNQVMATKTQEVKQLLEKLNTLLLERLK